MATGEGGWRQQGRWGGESGCGGAGRGWCDGEAGGVRVGEEGDGAARARCLLLVDGKGDGG